MHLHHVGHLLHHRSGAHKQHLEHSIADHRGWNNKRHWTVILRSNIKHCFIFLLLLHLLPAALAQQHPHDLLASHLQLQLQLVCAHPPSILQPHDLLDLQASWGERLHNHLDIGCEHQSLSLPDHRQVILHRFAFQLHAQHLLCQHRTFPSWSSMSPSSTYHHHNDSMTQPPPSDPKIIQGKFPEAYPKPQRHLGVGGRMRWVQSHLASLPADIEEELTSAAWASMPRAHHKQTSEEEKLASMPPRHRMQTSKQEKLTSALAIEPSEASRH